MLSNFGGINTNRKNPCFIGQVPSSPLRHTFVEVLRNVKLLDFSNKNFISSNLKNAKREQAALAKICDEDADDEEDAKIEVRQGASEHRDPDVKHVFYTSMDRSLVDPESDQLKMEAAEVGADVNNK